MFEVLNWPFTLGGAVVLSIVIASVATFVAGRVYSRRRRAFRFGLVGTAVMLGLVWIVVFCAAFTNLNFDNSPHP